MGAVEPQGEAVMRWRFGGGPADSCRGKWWAQCGVDLYRLHKGPRGYTAQGLTKEVDGRHHTREYRTLYGAKMGVAALVVVNDVLDGDDPMPF